MIFKFKSIRSISIQKRLLSAFIILTIIPMTVVGFLSYKKSSDAIQNKINTYSVQLIEEISGNIKKDVEKIENIITELSLSNEIQELEKISEMSDADRMIATYHINDVLIKKFSNMNYIKGFGLKTSADDLIYYGEENLVFDDDYAKLAELYNEAGTEFLLLPHNNNENMFLLCKNFSSISSGKTIGTLLAIIDEAYFSGSYRDINIGDGGEIFILDSDGVVVSSRSADIIHISKPYYENSMIERLKQVETDSIQSFKITIQDSEHMVAFSKIEKTNYYVVGTIPFSYLNAETNELISQILLIGILCIILALIISVVVTKSISSPLNNLVNLMKKAKNGDLRIKAIDQTKDELSVVLGTFNDMVENIKSLILKVQNSSVEVLNNSDKISSSSIRSYQVSEQISMTIQDLAQGISQQAGGASDGAAQMNVLSENINTVGDNMKVILDVITNTEQLSRDALASVNTLNNKAVETRNVTNKIVVDINELNTDMKEIRKIVKVIVDIAEQTNLLSLNASIEAARAGEAGKGFEVVAGEVKKLADQSKEASFGINNIINNIQRKTDSTATIANSAKDIISDQMYAVENTHAAFDSIMKAMDDISNQMLKVQSSVQGILTAKKYTVDSIEHIATISEEAAATVEEISANTEEQMFTYKDFVNLSKNLNDMAHELSNAINIFNI
ncbi:MAG: methyl-accepting chemotaxis protein [Clostridiaceae bacterium]|nr:methyl-accepting chemotaxis protein [Clostridiaceae bacterium]